MQLISLSGEGAAGVMQVPPRDDGGTVGRNRMVGGGLSGIRRGHELRAWIELEVQQSLYVPDLDESL